MAEGESAWRLARRLEDALRERRGPVRVVRTDNRVRMVTVRPRASGLEVRVARRLLELGDRSLEPLVAFVSGDPEGRAALRALIREVPAPPPRSRRRVVLRPVGRHHDLRPLLREEAERHLGELPAVHVTWGRRQPVRRRQRTIRLGAYCEKRALIRIHRLLDHPAVPPWFVGFILFHELLHHDMGIDESGPRRVVHPPEFRRREAEHPRFEDARRWERDRLPLLMAGRLPA